MCASLAKIARVEKKNMRLYTLTEPVRGILVVEQCKDVQYVGESIPNSLICQVVQMLPSTAY